MLFDLKNSILYLGQSHQVINPTGHSKISVTCMISGNHHFGSKDISSFDPISIFILLEKDSASIKTFFRNTLALLGLKMMNLGETGNPSVHSVFLFFYLFCLIFYSGPWPTYLTDLLSLGLVGVVRGRINVRSSYSRQ